MSPKEIVEEVIDSYGGVTAAQESLKYKDKMCVYNWRIRGLPKSRIVEIHIATGIPLDRLVKATCIHQDKDQKSKTLKTDQQAA